MSESTPNVVHEPAAHRYAIFIGNEEVGHLEYSQMVNEIHFTHTFVNPAHQGKNLAAILTKFALDDVRAKGKHKVAFWQINGAALKEAAANATVIDSTTGEITQ